LIWLFIFRLDEPSGYSAGPAAFCGVPLGHTPFRSSMCILCLHPVYVQHHHHPLRRCIHRLPSPSPPPPSIYNVHTRRCGINTLTELLRIRRVYNIIIYVCVCMYNIILRVYVHVRARVYRNVICTKRSRTWNSHQLYNIICTRNIWVYRLYGPLTSAGWRYNTHYIINIYKYGCRCLYIYIYYLYIHIILIYTQIYICIYLYK